MCGCDVWLGFNWLIVCLLYIVVYCFGEACFWGCPCLRCLPASWPAIVVFFIDCCIFALCELRVVLAFGGFYIFFSWCVHYWDIKIVVVEYAVWSGWFYWWSIVLVYTLLILTEVLEKVFDVCCKRGGGVVIWVYYRLIVLHVLCMSSWLESLCSWLGTSCYVL